ncbi:hypothetical protein CAOG_03751 [Capsaspora owczarzaki ATCC 30864]|uniref:Uncharacterized protein n=1 Tax=Capsaspora owczarzaki (strain ATCC 30864) TaxID=595528 RepID=A0A0D2WNR5_CAPO3|nr:hypothetical protein CAOG_03751 [Capsaspora owczarzaki ATCC 30864]KJE92860.1 hypothetical protein CAOG_003751 [Capsaspora owczarzaki ATCC 30864]|eukprot:XP_004363479.1 hypothetical protein CAOG_03751 [Capsaspora owczarzaki ATCC 30864]
MVAGGIVILIFTIVFLVLGGAGFFFAPKGPNRGLVQTMSILTAFCMWIFWLCTFMSQMNPLIAPIIKTEDIAKN